MKKPIKDELVTPRAARSAVALGMRSGGEVRTRGLRYGQFAWHFVRVMQGARHLLCFGLVWFGLGRFSFGAE